MPRARPPLGPTQMPTSTFESWIRSASVAMVSSDTVAPGVFIWITRACEPLRSAASMASVTCCTRIWSNSPVTSMTSTGAAAPAGAWAALRLRGRRRR